MISEFAETSLHVSADLFCIRDEVSLLHDRQVLEPNRGRHRMAACSKPVAKRSQRVGPVRHALVDLVAHQHGGERQIGRSDLLRHHQDIRLNAILFAGEQSSRDGRSH